MTRSTRWRVSGLTRGEPLSTSDTVDFDTSAARAMSMMVAGRPEAVRRPMRDQRFARRSSALEPSNEDAGDPAAGGHQAMTNFGVKWLGETKFRLLSHI